MDAIVTERVLKKIEERRVLTQFMQWRRDTLIECILRVGGLLKTVNERWIFEKKMDLIAYESNTFILS